MEDFIREVGSKLPCREAQLRELYSLLGEYDEPVPHCLFISGNTATGKSAAVRALLTHRAHRHATASCVETYTPRVLYETIIEQLRTGESEVNCRCDTLKSFVQQLNALEAEDVRYEPIVIVLDKAERLRSMDHAIISTFVRLREFCNLNICTILITDLVYENFFIKMGIREPIKMYFPNYSKEELFKIIFLSHESFANYVLSGSEVDFETRQAVTRPDLFANFLNAFLSVFYRPCRDLIELRHMARINFVKYCEPILRKEIKADDLPRLWRHISPILKASLELLYLRLSTSKPSGVSPGKENSNPDFKRFQNVTSEANERTLTQELTSTETFAQSFELPYYAKYLLIAAYLASYNPPKEDKRLFMKHHGKQRKRMQQVRAKAKIAEKLNAQLGPKVFTLDRLLAIFYAILEDKIGLTSNLLSQIATLVELKLLSSGKEVDLDGGKYKCVVGYDFIAAVARTVGFNIRKYLYDFI